MSDFLVVGGGIAGAAAGYFLAPYGRVTLLEAERTPGIHATGRSAAVFSEYYGNDRVRSLTRDSRAFYEDPPPGFTDTPLLTARGVLALETPGTADDFDAALKSGADAPRPAVELTPAEALRLCPALRPDAFRRVLHRPGTRDIDVDATHRGFLRALRAAGNAVVTGARVRALARRRGLWHADTPAGEFAAPIVVNAAGAWADRVAALAGARPAGLTPRRRTAAIAALPPGTAAAGWPLVCDVADTFYAKPESGGLLLSPVDADPADPGDVRPDDLGVALALERVNAVTILRLRHISHAWAGLRTATPDDTPVVGPDPDLPGFAWLAGLGGYGIQTAPAAGALLAALVAPGAPPPTTPGATPARGRVLPLK
ncbi:FAD-dependent catabolic D-arginine dehydrogenase DauA [Streptomyces sp. RB5]|uniref:FAD-dependent catabolic D-arginine dehydrogenase DauA n=1 Tax=Streptomyces smaragdinus TaxID=2585196 RepID=A0A7K0CFU7_9ACTN|nr:FAD-binding oxidoreductase [Streptomyces smaragdinus]MQY12349.1 FAD-dependent catabolic D-arginine dehydrogenase DauA [Streptomyces smaragdinus]